MGNKAKVGGGLFAAAAMLAIPFITDHEGESLTAYQDVVGVYTICNGETSGVKPGDRKTLEECRALTQSRVGQFMQQVATKISVPVKPATLAAHTSFAYNIGIAGYARSTTLALTNRGDIAGGCLAMKRWNKAGGRDCTIKANGCYGLIKRRDDEVNLCLMGIAQ